MSNNGTLQYGNAQPLYNEPHVVTPLQGLQPLANTVRFADGCNNNTKCTDYKKSDVMQAVMGTELVIVCLGLGN